MVQRLFWCPEHEQSDEIKANGQESAKQLETIRNQVHESPWKILDVNLQSSGSNSRRTRNSYRTLKFHKSSDKNKYASELFLKFKFLTPKKFPFHILSRGCNLLKTLRPRRNEDEWNLNVKVRLGEPGRWEIKFFITNQNSCKWGWNLGSFSR